MFSRIMLVFFLLLISAVSSRRTFSLAPSSEIPSMKIYMVHVDFGFYHGDCKLYHHLLKKVLHGRSWKNALVHCYKEVISGFAAILTIEEAEKLKGEVGVYSVAEHDEMYTPQRRRNLQLQVS